MVTIWRRCNEWWSTAVEQKHLHLVAFTRLAKYARLQSTAYHCHTSFQLPLDMNVDGFCCIREGFGSSCSLDIKRFKNACHTNCYLHMLFWPIYSLLKNIGSLHCSTGVGRYHFWNGQTTELWEIKSSKQEDRESSDKIFGTRIFGWC